MPPKYITIDTNNDDEASIITNFEDEEHANLWEYYLYLRRNQIYSNDEQRSNVQRQYNGFETDSTIMSTIIQREQYQTLKNVNKDGLDEINDILRHGQDFHKYGKYDETKKLNKKAKSRMCDKIGSDEKISIADCKSATSDSILAEIDVYLLKHDTIYKKQCISNDEKYVDTITGSSQRKRNNRFSMVQPHLLEEKLENSRMNEFQIQNNLKIETRNSFMGEATFQEERYHESRKKVGKNIFHFGSSHQHFLQKEVQDHPQIDKHQSYLSTIHKGLQQHNKKHQNNDIISPILGVSRDESDPSVVFFGNIKNQGRGYEDAEVIYGDKWHDNDREADTRSTNMLQLDELATDKTIPSNSFVTSSLADKLRRSKISEKGKGSNLKSKGQENNHMLNEMWVNESKGVINKSVSCHLKELVNQ